MHILIFGATGGIGQELVNQLKDNHSITAFGRDAHKLAKLAESESVTAKTCDVTDSSQVQHALAEDLATNGPPKAIINCVGSVLLKPAHLISDDEWQNTLTLNLTSSFYILKHGIKSMQTNGGSFVFCSTAASHIGLANHEAIVAAKAGLEGLVKSAAATYAGKNIRVNAVAPGLTQTPLTSRMTSNASAKAFSESLHGLGRLGEPHHIASAIAWLADDKNDWITGQTLVVDGGLSGIKLR